MLCTVLVVNSSVRFDRDPVEEPSPRNTVMFDDSDDGRFVSELSTWEEFRDFRSKLPAFAITHTSNYKCNAAIVHTEPYVLALPHAVSPVVIPHNMKRRYTACQSDQCHRNNAGRPREAWVYCPAQYVIYECLLTGKVVIMQNGSHLSHHCDLDEADDHPIERPAARVHCTICHVVAQWL